MKLRIWHFVTPTPTEWQQDKPADDNGTAEYFLDGCVAAHRTANNGWQTSPTRTPQRIWFLENVAGGPPEDVDGAWVRCYFDPQSGRWVALGNLAATSVAPEDPSNNDDCCEFGQLFICPLPDGIDYEVLCSAIDPPIDGEKMHKVRFFAVDANGNETESEDDNVILEHKELLTLPCTEEVCKNVDLSSVELDGVSIGIVSYGNHNGCCGGILFLQTATYIGPVASPPWVTGQTSLQRTISRPDANPPYNVTISTEVNLPIILREEDLSTFLEQNVIPYSIVTTVIESDIEITSFGSGSTGGVFGNPNVMADGPSTSQGPTFQNTVTGSFTVREDTTGEGASGGADFFIQSGNSVTTSNNQIISLGGVVIRYVRPLS